MDRFIVSFVFSLVCTSALLASYLAPVDLDLSADGERLYMTASSGREVVIVSTQDRAVLRRIALPAELSGAVLSADESMLYVTGGGPQGVVFELDVKEGRVVRELPAGHSPLSPVLSPDGARLYFCNQFNNDVSVIDLTSGEELARVPAVREPIAVDVTKDGRTLYVANLIPQGRADVDYVASAVSVIDTQTFSATTIPLVNGAEGMHGLKVSPDGQYVFATHIMARFQVPTTQLDRGWVATNALSVIRVADQSLLHTVLLDDMNLGFPNPWAIGFSGDGETLVVSSAGSHELSLIDLPALMDKIAAQEGTAEEAVHLYAHNDLSFLSGIRTRVPLQGNGPRSLVIDGQTAYVGHYFSDSIDVVDFSQRPNVALESVELNPGMVISQERQGEIFFHDASLCFQSWLSCSSCHPDARVDAMNWDLLNDGMGNPKNVKSLLYAHRTPPTTWLGVRANAEVSVRSGVTHIQFAVRPEADAEALDAYLKALRPLDSPRLVNGQLSASALRGKQLFKTERCNRCHQGELYTDMEQHEVGTTQGMDVGRPVDTPSLIELWRTAPYLHDGRAATVRDVLLTDEHAGIAQRIERLSDDEVDDLEEFLLSL